MLTPQNEKEIKLLEEIENQNKAEVVYEKTITPRLAKKLDENKLIRRRSLEVTDDDNTKNFRQSISKKY